MLTSIPGVCPLGSPEGRQSDLLSDSVTMTDNLATILGNEMDKAIGHFPSMSAVDEALAIPLAFSGIQSRRARSRYYGST